MRKNLITAFDDFVTGTDTVYSDSRMNSMLGSMDKMAVQCIISSVDGTSPTIKIKVEESNDQKNWSERSGGVDPAASMASGDVKSFDDDGSTPAQAFLRFKIDLAGTTPAAHVKILACQRDGG